MGDYGINLAPKEMELEDCEICGALHPVGFEGDCRDDANRYHGHEVEEGRE